MQLRNWLTRLCGNLTSSTSRSTGRRRRTPQLFASAIVECLEPRQYLSATPVPLGPTATVNSNVPGSASYPTSVASNAAGDYVVVWSTYFANNTSEIDGRRYCASGSPMGSQFTISKSSSPSVELVDPNVAINNQGQFVVTWFNIQNPQTNNPAISIHAQRFNFYLGKAQGTELTIGTSNIPGFEFFAQNNVGIDSNGDFVVVRESQNNVGDFIYAQVYNWSGSVKGNQITVASGNNNTTYVNFPTASMDSKGDFVVAWHSQDAVTDSAMARRYNLAGTTTSNLITVVTGNVNTTFHLPDVAINSFGGFVVAWDQYDQNVGDSIRAQQYDSLAHVSGSAITVSQISNNFIGFAPSVAMNAVGDFVVTWFDASNSNNGSVYAHAYKPSGQSDGSQVTVAQGNSNSFNVIPAVAMNGADNFVVVWVNVVNINQSQKFNILAQRYRN